jgi:hypothetical protein
MAARGAAFWAQAVIRTRFIDDWVLGAARQGLRQVVLVAAGLDTRAYRLEWPVGTAVYELDLPPVFVFKDSVLAEVGAGARLGTAGGRGRPAGGLDHSPPGPRTRSLPAFRAAARGLDDLPVGG